MTQPGLVAQLVERRCSNPEVVGSNPAGVKDFSFILVLISNFLLLRPVVGGNLWRAVSLTSWHSYIHTLHHKLEIRDSQNLAKLRHGCTTKLSDGGGEGIEFCFNWRCGWVATMVPNWELRSTFWFPFASM